MIKAPCTTPLAEEICISQNEVEMQFAAIGSEKTGKTGEFRREPEPVFLGRYTHRARRQE